MDPIELLKVDPDRIPSLVELYWGPTIGGVMGFGFGCFSNFMMKRPAFSGTYF